MYKDRSFFLTSKNNKKMNVESLDFWKQVKVEYIKSEYVYLCSVSDLFNDAFNINREEIKELASKFLKEKNNKKHLILYYASNSVLFHTRKNKYGNVDDLERRKIRLDFIDWCIEKYKNA